MAVRSSLNAAYLLIAGLVIAAMVLIFWVLRPMVDAISQTRHQTATTTVTLQERNQFLKAIDSKQTELTQQQAQEKILSVALPSKEAMENVSRVLHRAATTSGGKILKLFNRSIEEQRNSNARQARGNETDVPPNVVPLALDIDFVGTYPQLRSFLASLERSVRLFEIISLDIKPNNEKEANNATLRAKLTIRLFRHDASQHDTSQSP